MNTISFKRNETEKDFKAISLNNKFIVQSSFTDSNDEFAMDISELINFLIESVKICIKKMQDNSYNDFVNNNLPYENRYGTIVRNDYWKIYNKDKENYLKNITTSEIEELKKFVNL